MMAFYHSINKNFKKQKITKSFGISRTQNRGRKINTFIYIKKHFFRTFVKGLCDIILKWLSGWIMPNNNMAKKN